MGKKLLKDRKTMMINKVVNIFASTLRYSLHSNMAHSKINVYRLKFKRGMIGNRFMGSQVNSYWKNRIENKRNNADNQ